MKGTQMACVTHLEEQSGVICEAVYPSGAVYFQ
jgi:hypothetical protein